MFWVLFHFDALSDTKDTNRGVTSRTPCVLVSKQRYCTCHLHTLPSKAFHWKHLNIYLRFKETEREIPIDDCMICGTRSSDLPRSACCNHWASKCVKWSTDRHCRPPCCLVSMYRASAMSQPSAPCTETSDSRLNPNTLAPGTHWVGTCVDLKFGTDAVKTLWTADAFGNWLQILRGSSM